MRSSTDKKYLLLVLALYFSLTLIYSLADQLTGKSLQNRFGKFHPRI